VLPWAAVALGAALLSVSVVLKNFPLVAFPALVRQPRYWGHGVLAMTVLFIVTVPHFLNYPRQWEHFARVNFRPEGGFHAGNYGFLQLLHLAQQDIGAQLSYDAWLGWTRAFRLALLAATAGLVLLSRQASPLIGASALLLAHFVTYQHVWEHHFSGILAIGAVLLLSQAAGRKAEWTVMASMLVMTRRKIEHRRSIDGLAALGVLRVGVAQSGRPVGFIRRLRRPVAAQRHALAARGALGACRPTADTQIDNQALPAGGFCSQLKRVQPDDANKTVVDRAGRGQSRAAQPANRGGRDALPARPDRR
jgi:hypothetical protein